MRAETTVEDADRPGRGGKLVFFRLEFDDYFPILLLTEGEWDAMLLWEHCADLCDVGTIGGAKAKFSALDLALLTRFWRSWLCVTMIRQANRGGSTSPN